MNQLHLEIDHGRTAFNPGEAVTVHLEWELGNEADEIKVRLIWFTTGHGSSDFDRIQEESILSPGLLGRQSFQFTIPQMPYSFQGEYFSLTWAFEVELFPLKEIYRQEIVISPTGNPITNSLKT